MNTAQGIDTHEVIGIIGLSGAFGRWLEAFFTGIGYTVIGSSVGSSVSNQEIVEQADVVVFAVTLEAMVPVIRSVIPFSQERQLWIDIGSRKQDIVDAMLHSKAEVVGLHPLFAPLSGTDLADETTVFCPARLSKWHDWVIHFLAALGTGITECHDTGMHDRMMLLTQNVPHAALLAVAATWSELETNPKKVINYTTASSRLMGELIARMLANSAEIYADIQIGSDAKGLRALDMMIATLNYIRDAIAQKDRGRIVRMLDDLRESFGERFIAAGIRSFGRRK